MMIRSPILLIRQCICVFVMCILTASGYVHSSAGLDANTTNPKYTIASSPDWVRPAPVFADLPDSRKGVVKGSRTLLRDLQYNVIDRNQQSRFVAIEYELLSRGSVDENSTITIEFDPAYEQLIIHGIEIKRGGAVIDKLASARKRVLQAEDDLANLIYDGSFSFTAILSDVRRGDTIRYEYSVEGSNPIFAGHFEQSFRTRSYRYSHRDQYRILTAPGDDLTVRYDAGELPHSKVPALTGEATVPGLAITSYPMYREYRYTADAVAAVDWEKHTPSWRSPIAQFSVSDMVSWADVIQWSLPLYEEVIGTTSELEAIARSIERRHRGPEARIGAALAWVQSEIRYFGIELGSNSHQPSTPMDTLERRFGDCKDKTVLLISLLQALDIESQPALVNTRQSLRDPDAVSRMHAFNHVIVHVPLNGKSHWIDPTLSYQKGKIGDLYEPDYGFALVVMPESTSLLAMASPQSQIRSRFQKRLSFDIQDNALAQLKVESTRVGRAAERHRSYVSESGIDEVTDNYERYYQDSFSGLESTGPIAVQELPRNSMVTTERYSIEHFWGKAESSVERFALHADDVRDWMIAPKTPGNRLNAYRLPNQAVVSENWVIEFTDEVVDYNASETIETPEFRYSVKYKQSAENRELTIFHHFELLAKEVRSDRLVAYTQAINLAWDWTSLYITPNGIELKDEEDADEKIALSQKEE